MTESNNSNISSKHTPVRSDLIFSEEKRSSPTHIVWTENYFEEPKEFQIGWSRLLLNSELNGHFRREYRNGPVIPYCQLSIDAVTVDRVPST